MNLLLALDHHFSRTPDGATWSWIFGSSFWERYLTVFDHVRVLLRARAVPYAPSDWQRVDGPRVSVVDVPHYHGTGQYLRSRGRVRRTIREAIRDEDAVILRFGLIASGVAKCLHEIGKPYGLEIIGDPHDTFVPGAYQHPLRPLLRWYAARQLRAMCLQASATGYVTAHALQERYPPSPGAFSTHYSSVELPPATFVPATDIPRVATDLTLLTVATMGLYYKGHDVLIDALDTCVRNGLDLRCVLVGDGDKRPAFEAQAASLDLSDRVRFLGQLPAGQAVQDQLDAAAVLVLPSRTEGLPRALVEAMARGLPCIASKVGGIPELLPEEDMVPPGEPDALAKKITEVVTDPQRMARMSARNFEKAAEYRAEVLLIRRQELYRSVQQQTGEWLNNKRGGSSHS